MSTTTVSYIVSSIAFILAGGTLARASLSLGHMTSREAAWGNAPIRSTRKAFVASLIGLFLGACAAVGGVIVFGVTLLGIR
ncbi:Uncharacterised protein [Mycobacteroides abscessus subsp. abscessus]|nr:Uncharacterised protein [Mycobacteroides abscessus subsp. abscessus]